MNNVNDATELDAAPIKVRQTTDRRVVGELSTRLQPPAHVAALLQAEGMSYDPTTFTSMTLEQHAEEGFKGLRVSVMAAVHSGMHFALVIEKIKQAKESESLNQLSDFKSGKQFIIAQAELRGVSQATIYNMIDVYELFCRSPEKCAKPFAQLGFTKLLELKNFTQDDLELLAEGDGVRGITLEAAKTMSVSEIKAAFKEDAINTKAYRDLQKKMEEAKKIIQQKDAALKQENSLFTHTGQPPIVRNMRIQSTAVTDQVMILLDVLEDLEITLANGYESGLSANNEARHKQIHAALTPWTININVIQARLTQINTEARKHFTAPGQFPNLPDDIMQLSEAECSGAINARAFMTDLVGKVEARQRQGKRIKAVKNEQRTTDH